MSLSEIQNALEKANCTTGFSGGEPLHFLHTVPSIRGRICVLYRRRRSEVYTLVHAASVLYRLRGAQHRVRGIQPAAVAW